MGAHPGSSPGQDGHQGPLTCVASSKDGSLVLTGSVDCQAKLVNAATGKVSLCHLGTELGGHPWVGVSADVLPQEPSACTAAPGVYCMHCWQRGQHAGVHPWPKAAHPRLLEPSEGGVVAVFLGVAWPRAPLQRGAPAMGSPLGYRVPG